MDLSMAYNKPAVSTSARGVVLSAKRNHKPKLLALNAKGKTTTGPTADAGITYSQACFQLDCSSA